MDLSKMIAELQDEKYRLDEAIEALERLSAGQNRRRGRPGRTGDDTSEALPPPYASDASPARAKKLPETS